MRPRLFRAGEGKFAYDRAALKAHEIILEIEPTLIRSQSGAQPIVCRRQHAGTDAEAATEVGGDGGETLALPQPTGALDMNRKVAIAKAEPVLAAERRERFHERPRLVLAAPTEPRVVETGERVHQCVGVRRDMQAEMLEIIADIGDDEQIVRLQDPAEAERELGPADASRQGDHKIPNSSKQILVWGTNDAGRRRFRRGPAQAPDQDNRRRLIRLAHHERGGGGDLIRETDDADLKLPAKQIGPSAQIDQRGKAGDADRDPGGSLAPRTAETVVYHDGEIDPDHRREPAPQRLRAAIRVLRQQKHMGRAVRRARRSTGPLRRSP